jgi:hypothetical protein
MRRCRVWVVHRPVRTAPKTAGPCIGVSAAVLGPFERRPGAAGAAETASACGSLACTRHLGVWRDGRSECRSTLAPWLPKDVTAAPPPRQTRALSARSTEQQSRRDWLKERKETAQRIGQNLDKNWPILAQLASVPGNENTLKKARHALQVLDRILDVFEPGQLALSFNGGKESTVLMLLLKEACDLHATHSFTHVQPIWFQNPSQEFPGTNSQKVLFLVTLHTEYTRALTLENFRQK